MAALTFKESNSMLSGLAFKLHINFLMQKWLSVNTLNTNVGAIFLEYELNLSKINTKVVIE